MNISFENKHVLVTGAGRGIGRTTVKAFIRGNAKKVFALSRTKSYLDELIAEEPSVIPIVVDLKDPEATMKALQGIGPIDILVNNAGYCEDLPFLDITPEKYNHILDTNFKSAMQVSQIIIKGMVERKVGGTIVNVSSRISFRGMAGLALYGASKAALDSLTRTLAVEFGPHQIRVNSVNPGLVRTDMVDHVLNNRKPKQEYIDLYCSQVPLGKICEPEDVSNVILFLSNDVSSMLTGLSLPIDGGKIIAS